jgi:WD40 repeat protein
LTAENELMALGITADGSLWSIEEPGVLRQWSLATRKQVGQLALDELATTWAFNWAGRLLASGSDDVAVWEVSSGQQVAGWKSRAWVTALAFQPGHAVLAVGQDDGVTQVWDWAGQRLLLELRSHPSAVSAVSFSQDGTRLATAGEDCLVHVWSLAKGEKVVTLAGHRGRIPALAWHPDNVRLFSAGWDTTVRVWDTRDGSPIILLNNHASEVHAAALSGDGKLLASSDADSTVRIWDTEAYQEAEALRSSAAEVRCMAWAPCEEGRRESRAPMLAYGGADRVIYLWSSRQGAAGGGLDDAFHHRTCLAVTPEGSRLLSLAAGLELRGWEVESGSPCLALDGSPPLRAFALSPNGRWIAASTTGEGTATLGIYHSDTGFRQATCEGQASPVTALAFSPSSSLLASGGVRSSDVWLWTVPGGSPALLLNDAVDGCSVSSLAWHPEGRLLAVGGIDWLATGQKDGETVVWDTQDRAPRQRIPGGVTAVAYNPTDGTLALANLRGGVRLIREGTTLELAGHLDVVHALAFSKDGKWLASGGDDRALRLWDAASGKQAAAWALEDVIRAVAFSPSGDLLYTGNGNTSCYQIEVEQLLA